MPNPYFIAFELIIYVQFALCLAHALKHGPGSLLKLFWSSVFGILLEIATIRQLDAYHYGRFLIMISTVPLCIGVAWGSIIYSVTEFTDGTSLPRFARPVLGALLALNIDMALDAVAIRLGLWDWGQGLDFQYFGVPYANFLAWFWVVGSFSFGYRLLAHRHDWVGKWLAGPLGLLLGLAVVFVTNAFMAYVIPVNYHVHVAVLVLGAALIFIITLQPRLHQRPVAMLAFLVPFLTQAYALIAGLVSGVILEPAELLGMALAMMLILFTMHWSGLRHVLGRAPAHSLKA